VDWGGGQLVDLDAMRPDEELTALLYERVPDAVRPAGYVEMAAALTDEDLADRWAEAVERHLREELWDCGQSHGGKSALWAAVISCVCLSRRPECYRTGGPRTTSRPSIPSARHRQ
jgi:hypothetical protein